MTAEKLPEWPATEIVFQSVREPYRTNTVLLHVMQERDAALARMAALEKALRELRALVKGECPSLLDEDSGGDSRLDMEIEDSLAACDRKEAGR